MRAEPNQSIADDHYIAEARAGNVRAFAVLVDRYKYMVYTLAVRMLKHHEEAEEVAQDTFVKAYNCLDQFQGTAKFSTWLYRIAYHQSLDYLKKARRKPEHQDLERLPQQRRNQEPEVYASIEQEDRQAVVRNAFEKLSGEDSMILSLYYLEELSLEEISGIMNLSLNNAKVRLHRSRKRMAEIVKNTIHQNIEEEYG